MKVLIFTIALKIFVIILLNKKHKEFIYELNYL